MNTEYQKIIVAMNFMFIRFLSSGVAQVLNERKVGTRAYMVILNLKKIRKTLRHFGDSLYQCTLCVEKFGDICEVFKFPFFLPVRSTFRNFIHLHHDQYIGYSLQYCLKQQNTRNNINVPPPFMVTRVMEYLKGYTVNY